MSGACAARPSLDPETDAKHVTGIGEAAQAAHHEEATRSRKNMLWIGLFVAALGATGCSDVAGPALIEDEPAQVVVTETPSEQAEDLRERNKHRKEAP